MTRLLLAVTATLLAACPPGPGPGPSDGGPGGGGGTTLAPGGDSGAASLPAGLAPEDFDAFGPGVEAGAPLDAQGTFGGELAVAPRPALVFLAPREGSAAAARLAPESGLLASVIAGPARLTGAPPYVLSEEGPVTIDARTTLFAFTLMHPTLAHPDITVAQQQLEWLRLNAASGTWSDFDAAAQYYGEALGRGDDPFASPAFTEALTRVVSAVSEQMPAYQPTSRAQPLVAGSQARGSQWNVVSTAELQGQVGAWTLALDSLNGTALDYLFVVRRLDDASFPEGLYSQHFLSPAFLTRLPGAPPLARGVVGSKSYARYLDPLSLAMKSLTAAGASLIAGQELALPSETAFYEVRLLSGGFAGQAPELDFLAQEWAPEVRSARLHNAASAVFEGLSLVPGADVVLGEEAGKKALEAAVLQVAQGLETLVSAKGLQGVTMADLYELGVNTLKAAVDKLADEPREQLEEKGWKRLVKYFKAGGRKVVKFVAQVPGKLASGGAMTHRLARLLVPDSLSEQWIVAVEPDGAATFSLDETLVVQGAFTTFSIPSRVRMTGTALRRLSSATDEVSVASCEGAAASVSVAYDPPIPAQQVSVVQGATLTVTGGRLLDAGRGCVAFGVQTTQGPPSVVTVSSGPMQCGGAIAAPTPGERGGIVVQTWLEILGNRDWTDTDGVAHHEVGVSLDTLQLRDVKLFVF
jgi:hypothetical protein